MWLFDEQQDASPLLHAVCQRLIDSAVWAYVAADPGQAIYGWAGADPALFMWGWDYHQTQVMRQSWRCPQEILDLGENLLRGTDGFFDRHVAGRDRKDGEKKTVDNRKDAQFGGGQKLSIRGDGSEHPISPFSRIETAQTTELASLVSPHDDWLVLARTNWLANAVCRRLDAAGIPYQTLRGGNKWHAPERFKAVTALMDAASGRSINGAQWRGVLKHVPSKSDGEDLLVRGTKTFWADRTNEVAAKHAPAVLLDNFLDLGATAKAVQQLRDGRWRNWFAGAREMAEAIDRWGAQAVESSGIRVGTIHAAKGREAQNVAVILPVPRQVEMGRRTKAGADEAQRVAYVAVTRASERVVLLDDPKQRYRMEIP
jgi:superfamily I DNA/RNA helicase